VTHIGGFFNNQIVQDTKGSTFQSVAGSHNNVRYVGDNGANTFVVGGMRNRVSIENVGKDERIMLEGRPQDWVQAPDCNPKDGRVTYINKVTGNEVTVATDAGRKDKFVKSKVQFTGDYASLANPIDRSCPCPGGWNSVGNMALNQGSFDLGSYAMGYAAGRRDGFALGAGFAWAAMNPLPFGAWSCFV